MSHQTFWKSDMTTRVDERLKAEREESAQERDVYKAVDVRDRKRCRACGRKSNPDAIGLTQRAHHHHVVYRSAGGPTETWNVALVCAGCHDAEHVKRTLKIEGNADEALTFWKKDADGEWYVWRRELGVGRFERD